MMKNNNEGFVVPIVVCYVIFFSSVIIYMCFQTFIFAAVVNGYDAYAREETQIKKFFSEVSTGGDMYTKISEDTYEKIRKKGTRYKEDDVEEIRKLLQEDESKNQKYLIYEKEISEKKESGKIIFVIVKEKEIVWVAHT